MPKSEQSSTSRCINKIDSSDTQMFHQESPRNCTSSEEPQASISIKQNKSFSHLKQNKDGANAARTARITLMSMVLQQDYKGLISHLRSIGQDVHVKKVMLNIGQRQFQNRFLFQKELRPFFQSIFKSITMQNVQRSMRKNKRSQLDYKKRLELCYKYILKYKKVFQNQFNAEKQQIKVQKSIQQKQDLDMQIFVPIALRPEQYQIYMNEQRLFWFL